MSSLYTERASGEKGCSRRKLFFPARSCRPLFPTDAALLLPSSDAERLTEVHEAI
jgi:hypothetical protein